MCGIVGIFEYGSGRLVDGERLRRMNDTLVHRGPDEEGYFVAPRAGLAARRLSIVDIAHGQQPQGGCDGRLHIAFNGEIYNYRALRRELTGRTHTFTSASDTEVVLHLWEEVGAAALERLDGMFALAIHAADPAEDGPGSLVLARDRLGKKPLYYADVGGALIFASEIKPLLLDPRVSRDLDLEALHHYLSFLAIPAPFSIFAAIRKLPAGHALQCDSAGPRVVRYWRDPLGRRPAEPPADAQALSQEIRRLLTAAVEKRLMGDVPVGAFLSGGLDSTAVVAVMSRLVSRPIRTFSMGFAADARFSELGAARAVARHFGTDHEEIVSSADIMQVLPDVVRYADEPFAISSAVPTLLLARAAGRSLKVVLTGDGGDEVFAGYPRHLYERWSGWYRRVPAAADPLVRAAARVGGRAARVDTFVDGARAPIGTRRLSWGGGWSEEDRSDLYTSALLNAVDLTASSRLLDGLIGDVPDALRQHLALDLRVWLPDEMLCKVDRMTMAASLEARCPLLDVDLLEFVAGVSDRAKLPFVRRGRLKDLLRRALAPLVPADLLDQPKHGFDVPLDDWFRGPAATFLQDALAPERVRRRGLFNPETVSALVTTHQAGRTNAGNRLYALVVFELWAREYLD